MAKFKYIITAGFEVEAPNSDVAYDLFQEKRLKDAFWDNTHEGVELIEGEEEWEDVHN